ncbi:helix-turn-helix transcriptional regulator [Luethyella okanaganae]|uniref:Helix-turn-helix transcriptional regulator n=1 Tax=Luethyella okanaganae TaxID=69372 RepID=A0ABW1VGR0_9MICO
MRVTAAFLEVLRYLTSQSESIWGLQVCKATGLPSGTVYPILSRLEEYGWIEGVWDESDNKGPRRRLYRFTTIGKSEVAKLIESRAEKFRVVPQRKAVTT